MSKLLIPQKKLIYHFETLIKLNSVKKYIFEQIVTVYQEATFKGTIYTNIKYNIVFYEWKLMISHLNFNLVYISNQNVVFYRSISIFHENRKKNQFCVAVVSAVLGREFSLMWNWYANTITNELIRYANNIIFPLFNELVLVISFRVHFKFIFEHWTTAIYTMYNRNQLFE